MVSLINCLLGATTLLSQLSKFAAAADPYFSNVSILDSYTESNDCTDLDHWFIIQPEIVIPKNSELKDIQITIPLAFNSYQTGSFDLTYGSTTIGTIISQANSNTLTVTFNDYITTLDNDITADFNFLAKFSESAKKLITKPMSISYNVNATDSKTFTPTINFVGVDLTQITTDGGIFAENNTAWFVVNVPVALLVNKVAFDAQPSGTNSFQYDTSLTSYQVITSVDSFNEPLTSVPFTAIRDQSTSKDISFYIDTNVSGGKYVRVTYYSEPLSYYQIMNSVTIDGTTAFDSILYNKATVNVQLTSSNVGIQGLSLTLAASNETTAALSTEPAEKPTATATPIHSSVVMASPAVEVESLFGIDSNSNVPTNSTIITSAYAETTTSAHVTAVPMLAVIANNATVSSSVSVTSKLYGNDTYETYSIIEATQSAVVTEITKLVPVATLSGKTISAETTIVSTKSAKVNVESASANDKYQNSTTTLMSTFTETTTSCSETSTLKTSACSNYTSKGYVVSSETISEQNSVITNLVPISTLASQTAPKKTKTSTTSIDVTDTIFATESCTSKTIQTSVSVEQGHVEHTETVAPKVTSFISLLGGSSIQHTSIPTTNVEILVQSKSSASNQTTHVVPQLEASSNQLTIGLSGLIISFITLLI